MGKDRSDETTTDITFRDVTLQVTDAGVVVGVKDGTIAVSGYARSKLIEAAFALAKDTIDSESYSVEYDESDGVVLLEAKGSLESVVREFKAVSRLLNEKYQEAKKVRTIMRIVGKEKEE